MTIIHKTKTLPNNLFQLGKAVTGKLIPFTTHRHFVFTKSEPYTRTRTDVTEAN